jgi:hypothetical protein
MIGGDMKKDDSSLWPLSVAALLVSLYVLDLKWFLISAAVGAGGMISLILIGSMIDKIRSVSEDRRRGRSGH